MKFLALFLLTSGLFLGQVKADEFYKAPDMLKGEVQDKGDHKLLYNYTRTVTHEGATTTVKRTFTYPDGRPAANEIVIYNGDKAVRMELEQLQTNEKGFWEIKDGKIEFSYTHDGKTKTDDEKYAGNQVSTDEIVGHLHKNWEALMKGESVDIRFPVIFRTETVGFKFFKDGEDGDTVTIKMKPSSFVIAAIVKPLLFKFKKTPDHRLLAVDGRTTPKLPDGKSWKDLDAHLVFNY